MIKKLFFIYTVMLLIVSESCFCMQKEKKDLKTIFHENRKLLIENWIEPVPTSQNVNMFLWLATKIGDYPLVEKIVGAMKDLDLIEQYTQLYQAVRAGKKGIETLRKLLEKGVNPNGFALHDSASANPLTVAKCQYGLANDNNRQWCSLAPGFKKDYKKIRTLLKETGFEKESPLTVAQSIDNYDAIKLLLRYGAYYDKKIIFYLYSHAFNIF